MESLYKNAYDCCVKVNWDVDKLTRYSKELIASPEEILKWGKLYQSKLTHERGPEITVVNPILLELYNKKVKVMWEDAYEKRLVLKYIYNYCEQNQYDEQAIVCLGERFGYLRYSNKILEYAKEYATTYLKMSSEEYKKRKEEYGKARLRQYYQERETKSKKIFTNLLKAKTLEEIINVIENSDTSISSIRSLLGHYVMLHHNNDIEIEQILRKKITMYTNYTHELLVKRKEEEARRLQETQDKKDLPEARKYIKKFITDSKVETKEQFCAVYNIEEKLFDYYVEVLNRQETELYNKYKEKKEYVRKKSLENITREIKYIVYLLKNGVEENGIIRPFDLIDYYMITKRNINETLKYSRLILNEKDAQILKLFVKKNDKGGEYNKKDIELIMSEKVEVNCQKNKNGVIIPGTGEIFSNENKLKIIEYLKQNNIQVNRKTYTVAFRRYINGYLDLTKIKKVR